MLRRITEFTVTTLIVLAALSLASLFAYTTATGATLITFRTGSMAPTMPQGSLAVTIPVKASALTVGDVVTVQRAGEVLPVTHRIIEIGAVEVRADNEADVRAVAPGSDPPDLSHPDARQIVMKGDANKTPDQLPYIITDAYKVVVAIPRLGSVISLSQSPLGTGILLLFVGGITVWAFWPKPTRADNNTDDGDTEYGDTEDDDTEDGDTDNGEPDNEINRDGRMNHDTVKYSTEKRRNEIAGSKT